MCETQQCLLRTSAVNINDLQGAVVLDPLDPSFGSLLRACTFANLRHLGPEKQIHMDPSFFVEDVSQSPS